MVETVRLGAPSSDGGWRVEGGINLQDTMALQSNALAEQSGKLQGMQTAISAFQASLSSWQTVVIGTFGVILAAIGIVVAMQISRADSVESRMDRFETKLEAMPKDIADDVERRLRPLIAASNVSDAPPTRAAADTN